MDKEGHVKLTDFGLARFDSPIFFLFLEINLVNFISMNLEIDLVD